MLNKVRLKLTALYLLATLAFVVLVIGVMYGIANYYFHSITDQALLHKMSHEFMVMALPLPKELEDADLDWHVVRQRVLPAPFIEGLKRTFSPDTSKVAIDEIVFEEAYDGDLASIFIMPLDAQGQPIPDPSSKLELPTDHTLPDRAAVQAALNNGSDLRTMTASNGVRVRLLTYRLPPDPNRSTAFLQLGSIFADEDFLLSRLLFAMLAAGVVIAVLSGAGSWWLAGRSLRPTQAAWRRQQTFVANASHELRTPLTLIRASAEMTQRGLPAGDQRRRLLDDVISQTDHMAKLVDDLLLLSRLDAGQLKLDRQTIQLSELLPTVQQHVAPLAQQRGVQVGLDRAEGTVFADPTRLREVLLVLLDNSLRHTPAHGSITLASQLNEHVVQISVVDTGEGIAPEHLSHVFDRFYQADSSRGKWRGAGLGLSIAKSLIELHGGQVCIDSKVGAGTRVTISLPATRSQPDSEP